MNMNGNYVPPPVILVVDDEEPLRRLVYSVLRANGFRVLAADSSARAIEIAKRVRRPIHALVSDVQLPGMSGFELADHIGRLKPGLPVLLMSGSFTADDSAVKRFTNSSVRFLEKPFTSEMLVSRVREALRSATETMSGTPSGCPTTPVFAPVPMQPATSSSMLIAAGSPRAFDPYQAQVRHVKDYAMFMMDEQGILTSWNAGVESLLGYSEQEWIGQHASIIFEPESHPRKAFEAETELARTAGSAADVGWHRRRDGTKLFASGILNVVRDGQGSVLGYVKIMGDDTVRHVLLDKLTGLNLALEQFGHIASHELQEPLRTMTAFAQLLERNYRGKLDAEADQFLGFIVNAADSMSKLVADLLIFARAGGEQPRLAPIALDEGLQAALADLAQAIQESGASVTHDPLPTVQADGRLVRRLFQNLVGNAIRYRKPGKEARVRVRAERQDGHWIIEIQDNGIGFEPQYATRIFSPFNRLNAESDYPGTGMGLAICRRIVEAHGGRIWAESQPGEGSTFRFALPVEPQPTLARQPDRVSPPGMIHFD